MESKDLDDRIISTGKNFFSCIQGEKPTLFNKNRWVGKVMDWCMRNEDFRLQLFRFVDVFPCLRTNEMLTSHIREYFSGENHDIPAVLKWGAQSSGLAGAIGATILNKVIKTNIEEMARQFIVGEQTRDALKNIGKLRDQGFAFVVDVLGEATVSEQEADTYVATYLELLQALQQAQGDWRPLGNGASGPDWGHAPKINVSVKPSAFYSQTKPQNFEGSVATITARISQVYERVIALGGFLCIDMESSKYKDITLEVFRRLRLRYRDYPHLGVVLQAYLTATDKDLDELLAWAQAQKLPISIRLVKGAYWDYETVLARQNGWPSPVYTVKAQSDAAFERHAATILQHHAFCHLACGSHNIRSIAATMEIARQLGVPEERYEFQVLYGMAEPVRKGLLEVAGRIRLYCPYGEMIPGMAYLVRRLLENTANESFLRQSFAEETEIARLLEDPQRTAERQASAQPLNASEQPPLPVFCNEPAVDFTVAAQRQAFADAIARVRSRLGQTYPLFIDGKEVKTEELLPSTNPADPAQLVGEVCLAGVKELEQAIAAAKRAFPAWRDTPAEQRADYLFKAAEAARARVFDLAAWQVLEIGKQWDQAYADVTEAIDFLDYYAREMIRLGGAKKLGSAPGEENRYSYEPRGVAAVISPWNFPLAISCGMAAAAIVAGNSVVFKPSGLTPVIGHQLVELFTAAGLPAGVFNYLPGRGSEIGDPLVEHAEVSLIAFTGSMEVGLRIVEKAARVQPGQRHVKRVIAEMGGKNAIIIDDDADLDEAVPHVLYSAFGFQGQKCSACSRVIVVDAVYDHFVERLVEAAKSLKIGPAEDPANYMGPVADAAAQEKILEYIELAGREGKILYRSRVPNTGFYVPLTIVANILPEHRIAQEEVFGPLLAVMRAEDFNQALEWANGTRFALTGALFSRSPAHLEQARREFRVGNLYLNRNCVGALVERQPFGGAAMSGLGTKAGGPDYLLHFMDPRTVTENTMRRGFAPEDA
ncbi:L-glutamate gamma-semialdehyde dehydrogenase [Trichloromonas sp.]|uniref:L-glutamate gamma-semialdehyde dehydrogenase n=1 Tax=Trichloromonas sp. TaxID=3069249 RepID=UPI003D81680A